MMEQTLFTNSNARADFIRDALLGSARDGEPALIATAFFTDYDLLRSISVRTGQVKLVVRLGYPTSPLALEKALANPNIDVRYFTDHTFHPKLYLFGDRVAYVGSANLTSSAVIQNQEIMLAVDCQDERLEALAGLFGEYWAQASVLTDDALEQYRRAYAARREIETGIEKLQSEIDAALGNVRFSNIDRDVIRKTKDNLFVDGYRRTYQEAVSVFARIRDLYEATGKRKVPEAALPLRLEIDSFFSFVRDHIATGETWREVPVGWNAARQADLAGAMESWHATYWPHLETTIVEKNYPRLRAVFDTEAALRNASIDQIFDALLTLHSFHDRLRFNAGGIPGLKASFVQGNDVGRVKDSLAYLVHGKDELVRRMANLIYRADYKLNSFGTANVQEMIGWHNKEELPVINGRTTKVLRYFGFDVRQL